MKKFLFLLCVLQLCCIPLLSIPAHGAQATYIEIPVTIDNGGSAVIVTQVNSPVPRSTTLQVEDGEEGRFIIDFTEEGDFSYILMVLPDERNITYDRTVYTANIHVTEINGALSCVVVIYNNTTGMKPDAVHFENVLAPPTEPPTAAPTTVPATTPATEPASSARQPRTGDDTRMELYLLLAVLASAGIFALSVAYTVDTNRLYKKEQSKLF